MSLAFVTVMLVLWTSYDYDITRTCIYLVLRSYIVILALQIITNVNLFCHMFFFAFENILKLF